MIRKLLCRLGFHKYDAPVNHCGSWFRVCKHCQNDFQIYARGHTKNEWRECEITQDSRGRFFVTGTNGNKISLGWFV
jgi:hypothetical protein